jgi:hypothetical protein
VPPVARISGTTVVLLDIGDSTGDVIRVETSPEAALSHCTKRMLAGREVLEFYWPGHPRVEFLVFASSGASSECARFIVPADGAPVPDPPFVDPAPTPTIVTEVVVVRETKVPPNNPEAAKRATQQAAVILATAWREHLKAAEIPFLVLDDDQLPQRLQPLKAKAAGSSVVFFLGEGGVDAATMLPLPIVAEEMLKLVKGKIK